MKQITILFILNIFLFSCTQSDNTIDQVFDTVETGAVLYTAQIDNLTLDQSKLERPIQLTLEYQDGKGGTLLESVDIFIAYEDRTLDNGNNSKASKAFRTLTPADFNLGENTIPATELIIETNELLGFFNLTSSDVHCTDRFVIDLTLNLTDGRFYNNANSDGTIISLSGTTGSPFTYDVYVVEGVNDDFLTGTYSHTSIQDGFEGPTFIMPEFIEITSKRPNARNFEVIRDEQTTVQGGLLIRGEVDFTIACDQIILTRYIRSTIICASGVEGDQQVLLGPAFSELTNTVDLNDDAVFDLKFIEGFEGYDGICGWPETLSIVRFSKQ